MLNPKLNEAESLVSGARNLHFARSALSSYSLKIRVYCPCPQHSEVLLSISVLPTLVSIIIRTIVFGVLIVDCVLSNALT